VLFRRKMGFGVPMDVWFRGSLREHLSRVVTGPRLAASEIFDPAALRRLVAEHDSGRRDHSAALWALLMFDSFLGTDAGEAAGSGERSQRGAQGKAGLPESKAVAS